MCKSLRELLASQNYELNTANSAKEAIEFLNNNSVDLILLDLYLPDMNSYQKKICLLRIFKDKTPSPKLETGFIDPSIAIYSSRELIEQVGHCLTDPFSDLLTS